MRRWRTCASQTALSSEYGDIFAKDCVHRLPAPDAVVFVVHADFDVGVVLTDGRDDVAVRARHCRSTCCRRPDAYAA